MPRVFKLPTCSIERYHFLSTFVHNMKNLQRKKRSETQKSALGICSGNETALAAFSSVSRSVSDACHNGWLCEYTQDVLQAPHDHTWHLMALRSTFCSFFWQNKDFPLQRCAPSSWENHGTPIVLDWDFSSPLSSTGRRTSAAGHRVDTTSN